MNKVKKALNTLAQMEANEIAAFFYKEGITGNPDQANHCPVANYLRTTTGEKCTVWRVKTDYPRRWLKRKVVYLPDSVRDFVDRFDSGEYPLLEEWSTKPRVISPIEF